MKSELTKLFSRAAGTLALTARRATTLTATRAAMMLLVMMLTMTAQTAWAQDPPQYPPLPDPDNDGNVTLVEPFYSVTSDVNISGNITANDPVNLTISSGATLSVRGIEGEIIIDVQGGSFIGQTCTIKVSNSQNATIKAFGVTILDGTTITNSNIVVSDVILAYGSTFSGSNVTVNSYLQLLGDVVFDASSPAVSINVNEYDNEGGSLTISNGSLKDGDGNIYEEGPVANPSVLNGKTLTYYNASSAITVSLNAQGGSGGTESVTPTAGEDMPAITPPTKTGYTFGGYYIDQGCTGTQYYDANGTSAHVCDLTGTVTLYAKWTANTYTVTFDRQGGSGGTESVNNATFGSAMPAITPPTRTDCEFFGYYTAENGGGTKYYNADGSSARTWGIGDDATLYAYWKKYLHNADITIEIPAQTYSGSQLTPVVTVKDNGIEVSDAHYNIILPEGRTNAGDYTINIEAKEGSTAYVMGTQATFTISPKALTVTANPKTITYGDAPANDGVTYSGFVDGENESVLGGTLGYTYNTEENGTGDNYTASSPVGTYYIIPSGLTATNYDITFANGTLTVNPKSVTVTGITVDNKTYDGTTTAALNAANATVNGKVGEDNVTVNIDNATAVFADANAGTGKAVTITGVTLGGDKANNYTLSDQPTGVTGTIDKDASSVTAAPTAQSLVYNGSEQTLINAGTASGGTMNYSLDNSTWSTALPTATDAGEYTIYYKVEGDGNHNNTDAASIMAYIDYTITYELDGGSVATANPTRYNVTTATFTLTNPTLTGYDFAGWTGTDLTDATETVTIAQGSTGNRSYTATWTKTPVTTSYIDENGIEQTHAATEIDGSQTNLPGGWYVVNSNVALTRLNFTGDAHLILADGKTLSIDASSDSGENNCYFGLSCKEGTIGIDATYHDLTIYGQAEGTGKVTANHGHPGYATSYAYYAHSITINGGVVEATSSGKGFCGTNITINGGQILFNNNNNCAEIMAGNSIVLGWRKPSDFIQAYRFVNPGGNTTIQIANGKVFTDGTGIYDNTTTTGTLQALQNVTLRPCLVLADNASNADAIAAYNGKTIAVALDGRTLTKDGNWNTLCLPFAVTISGSPLEGNSGDNPVAKVFANTSSLSDGGVLTLKFSDAPATIPAGTPFIMKWTNTATTITNPVFIGATISSTTPSEVTSTDTKVKFVGQYSPFSITTDNIDNIIYLGANNAIDYASASTTLQSFSTHFVVPTASPSGRAVTAIATNLDNLGTPVYSITYDLAGGSLAEGVTNPTEYTSVSDAITLNNPTREGYDFAGWTGTGLTEATTTVTIATGSSGNREYTATWKKQLTITADSDTKNYDGTALTKNSYTYTGLVEGDVINSVTVTGSQTNVGSSNNVPSAAVIKDANNVDVTDCYNITYENGTLTVNPASVTLTANSRNTDIYDGTEKTVTGFTSSVDGLTFAETVTATGSGTDAGTYDVTFSGVSVNETKDNTGNYVVTGTTSGTLTISPKPVTVTGITADERVYNGEMTVTLNAANASIDGKVGDEAVTVDVSAAIGTMADANVGTGKAVTVTGVSLSGADADNYRLSAQPTGVTVDITTKTLTITADAKSKYVGQDDPALTYQSDGLLGTDAITGALAREAGEAVGTYGITQGTLTAGDNYNIAFTGATFTINSLLAVSVPEAANGNSIVASPTTAAPGTQITLTITTAEGYTLKSISATGVALSGTGTTRTFPMPAANVTVTATWEEKTQESATTEVTENVDIVDGSNATVTSVEVGAQTTSITISGTVSDGTNDVPVTSIANGVFTAENTANVKSLDLSQTAITLTGDARDANGPLANVDENTIIYLPATASATGVNVVKTDGSCAEVKIGEGKSFINSKGDITTKKFSFDRIFLTGENQLNTVFLPVNVPAAVAATFGTFYTCSSVDANGAVLSVVTGDLTANTAYVFKPASGKSQIAYEGSETLTIKVNANITNPTGAGLKGTFVLGTISVLATDPSKAYGYAAETKDGATVGAFCKLTSDATVPAYRGWLEVEDASSPQLAIIIEGEGATSIRSIDGVPVNEGAYYDLNGRKLSAQPTKPGLYINNGKKVVIK